MTFLPRIICWFLHSYYHSTSGDTFFIIHLAAETLTRRAVSGTSCASGGASVIVISRELYHVMIHNLSPGVYYLQSFIGVDHYAGAIRPKCWGREPPDVHPTHSDVLRSVWTSWRSSHTLRQARGSRLSLAGSLLPASDRFIIIFSHYSKKLLLILILMALWGRRERISYSRMLTVPSTRMHILLVALDSILLHKFTTGLKPTDQRVETPVPLRPVTLDYWWGPSRPCVMGSHGLIYIIYCCLADTQVGLSRDHTRVWGHAAVKGHQTSYAFIYHTMTVLTCVRYYYDARLPYAYISWCKKKNVSKISSKEQGEYK